MAKKEVRSCLTTPVIYAVLTVFLGLSGYFFYSNLLMEVMLQGTQVRVDLWQYTFSDMRFVLLLLLPLVSMRVFAEERRLGTIELLFTSPLRDVDIVAGKFLACLAVLAAMLVGTFLYPALFRAVYPMNTAVVACGYLGLFLLGAAALACGMFVSSRTGSQIVAAILTAGCLLLLWHIDRADDAAGGALARLLLQASFQKHFFGFQHGVAAVEDVLYYAAAMVFFIYLTLLSLQAARSPAAGKRYMRRARMAGQVLLLLAVLSGAVMGAARLNLRLDFTPGRAFTLSPVTDKIISGLEKRCRLTVACGTGQRYAFEDLLSRMARSSPQFQYDLIDADRHPARARALGIEQAGSAMVAYDGRRERIPAVTEAGVVRALANLTRARSRTVRFMTGATGGIPEAYGSAVRALKDRGLGVEPLRLMPGEEIPADTLVLIVCGPAEDLSLFELEEIQVFFDGGGKVLMLLDELPLPRVRAFLAGYNLELGNDLVIDRRYMRVDLDELTAVIFLSREHPVCTQISAPVVFPKARSVQVGTSPQPDLSWSIVARSGRGTWAERDLRSAYGGGAEFSDGEDVYGPVSTGVVVRRQPGNGQDGDGGSMMVLGNAAFVTDRYFGMMGNADFFLSAVTWLADQTAAATDLPEPRAADVRPLLRFGRHEDRLFFWPPVVVEPAAVVCLGVLVLLRRRSRGSGFRRKRI